MTKRRTVFASLLALLVAACASMQVSVNYDQQTDFKAFKTFCLVPPRFEKKGLARNPLFTKEVLNEIKSILEKKGLTEAADRESSDLLVNFYAMVKNRRDFVLPSYRVGRWGRVWAVRPGHVVRYKEGTLIIDMVDRAKNDLVWEGEGRSVLDRTDPSRNLIDAVGKVLEPFPPSK
jgi:hypothetical protein